MTAKVFVGNLVFSTTDEDLKQAFSSAAPVLSANIITRGRRSLGYGFVEFASESDAEKAVAAMNKKEIAGRAINVEVARPRDPAKEAEVREKKAARVSKPRAPKTEGADSPTDGAGSSPNAAANGRGGRRRGPRRGGRKTEGGASSSSAPGADGATSSNDDSPAPNGNGRVRRTGGAGGATGAAAGGARRPRTPKRPAETRPASDTTLFVANVPFTTDDAQLLAFFAEHNPKSAHVVRMRNGRSRGYGFVEFEDKNGQTAGLAVDGKDVPLPNGTSMKLSVKVAMTPPIPSNPEESSDPATSGETPQN